ncbi:MAG TPA: JAB domain-containing protein [Prevotellaceae bacterium]|nr:JAB domain-containing protein [Prevotellaceae bacterium]
MRKGFEVNGDYRLMDSSELVYILTNSAVMVNKVQEKEVGYGEECSFEEVLAKMTPGKRTLVMAGVELYKRCNSNKNQRPTIKCSLDIFDYMQPVLEDNRTEECWAIFMNSSARVIKRIRISSGGINTCMVDVRVMLKEALLCEATSFAFCHNHPSGNNRPSTEDDKLTQNIVTAAKTLNIRMLDHLIICNDSYFSYADEGRI